MSPWQAIPFILLGVLVVLLPVGVIGVFASHLLSRQRMAFLLLYTGAVLLLSIIAADIMELVPDRLAIDLILLAGGLAVGGLAVASFPFPWSLRGRAIRDANDVQRHRADGATAEPEHHG